MRYEYKIHTFGCKVNTYDSGLIEKSIRTFGSDELIEEKIDPVRIHVLNTCAVTKEATLEAMKSIRRLKIKDPFCKVIVTGCGAQVDTEKYEPLPGADLIIANSHKSQLPQIIDQYFKGEIKDRVFKSNIFKKEELDAGGGLESNHTRSFLKIQDGCNSFCTYCIIPYARGKSRSIPIKEIVNRVNELSSLGVNEVVLTGVHIGDYDDQGQVIEDLLQALLLKTKMPRFRLTSFEPPEISNRLIELFQDSRLCPHFHMSIQSANTQVLSDMKRKYTAQQVEQSLSLIAKNVKDVFIGMDVIVGFPTETEEYFNDTLQRLKNTPWSRMHVFPYSERPGTRAVSFDNLVKNEEKVERARLLRQLSAERVVSESKKQMGKVQKTLLLKKSAKSGDGITRNYWPVKIVGDFPSSLRGHEVLVQLNHYQEGLELSREGFFQGEIVGLVE